MLRLSFTGPAGIAAGWVLAACTSTQPASPAGDLPVAQQLSEAQTTVGAFISWREHLIDAEDVNGGTAIRGGDGLAAADLDGDGYLDIVSVHEDSGHIRIAFGGPDPGSWELKTLVHGAAAGAVEDVAIGDLNGDGWPDIIAACEEAHLIYLENPGTDIRDAEWPSVIPGITTRRGSWLRVFLADINGDGRLDVTAANKGGTDIIDPARAGEIVSTTSLFLLDGPPLEQASWREQVLLRRGIANTAMPVDIDGDGDLDILAAARVEQQMVILENLGTRSNGTIETAQHPIRIVAGFDVPEGWEGKANAFQSEFADIDGDGRLDLIVNALETGPGEAPHTGLVWLRQPASLADAWTLHRIGDILPDWIAGIKLADINGNGRLDAVVGGYSGLNILAGTFSGAPRLHDDPDAAPTDTMGRIAWFENPGREDLDAPWKRHEISRRVRDMNDAFLALDLTGDGHLDLVTTRGNSAGLDGVFWLEQVRTPTPQPNLNLARESDSRQMPLPPDDWLSAYRGQTTYETPPNAE